MSQGESALLYPGGVREAFKSTKRGEAYQLFWPDGARSSDFARVAARFNATIVPVAAIGAEEGSHMLLDADDLLALPILGRRLADGARDAPAGRVGERFVAPLTVPAFPGRYYYMCCRPIPTAGVDAADKAACAELYGAVRTELEEGIAYLLAKRREDPHEGFLPRGAVEAWSNWTRQAPTFPT